MNKYFRGIPKNYSYRIGRGKYFSIAKAALIHYFEYKDEFSNKTPSESLKFYTYGDLAVMHQIVDIAGAKQMSFFTPTQVIACLRNSPYWKCENVNGFYAEIGNGKASCCEPSIKGIEYYNKFLKNRKRYYS